MRLEAAEGGGDKEEVVEDSSDAGEREGEGWRGSDVTTEIKSNANTKLHYPSRTLTDPSSLPSCSHTPLPPSPGTPARPFLPVLSPSLRFSHIPPFAHPPHEIPPTDP